MLYLNYAAVDPVLTNDKCSYWHFRWDANSDIKMAALTTFMKGRPNIKKVYLINQDYSFGQSVRTQARAMLKEKRPDIEIVGDELHPLLKITDFSPYIAKIKASGADSVITGNWGQDIALLLKAAADAGLQTDWYTYYAGGAGGPTAIKQTGLVASRLRRSRKASRTRRPRRRKNSRPSSAPRTGVALWYPRAVNEMRMLAKAINQAKSRRRQGRRRAARGHEGRGFRRRRRMDAQGRPSVLPGHVHRQLRPARPRRQIRRGRNRLGLEDASASSRRTTRSCRRPARWSGPNGEVAPAGDACRRAAEAKARRGARRCSHRPRLRCCSSSPSRR